jgi:hypothetical protein
MAVAVTVCGWQCGSVVGEKMEGIGPVLREIRVVDGWEWQWQGGSGSGWVAVAVAVDGWQWQWMGGSGWVAVGGSGRVAVDEF